MSHAPDQNWQLHEIEIEHEAAFLEMITDYQKNDPVWLEASYPTGSKSKWSQLWFRQYIKECETQRMDWRPKPKKTSVSRYVMTSPDGKILATGWMQFPLNEKTEVDGGNLFCDVPPSLRRQGYGSRCLSLLLFEAVRAGLRRALVTCPSEDKGARKIIELNRGKLQDLVKSTDAERGSMSIARYWISFS